MLEGSIKVEVGNGTVGLGSPVAWVSERYGVKSGKVSRIKQEVNRYGPSDRFKTSITVNPDTNGRYTYPVTLRKLKHIISLDPQGVLKKPEVDRAREGWSPPY